MNWVALKSYYVVHRSYMNFIIPITRRSKNLADSGQVRSRGYFPSVKLYPKIENLGNPVQKLVDWNLRFSVTVYVPRLPSPRTCPCQTYLCKTSKTQKSTVLHTWYPENFSKDGMIMKYMWSTVAVKRIMFIPSSCDLFAACKEEMRDFCLFVEFHAEYFYSYLSDTIR